MGDRYLRKLLIVGACATLCHRKGHNDALRRWASAMLERKTVKYKFKLTAVALANKVARIAYALMTRAANTATGRSRPDGLEGSSAKRILAARQGSKSRAPTK